MTDPFAPPRRRRALIAASNLLLAEEIRTLLGPDWEVLVTTDGMSALALAIGAVPEILFVSSTLLTIPGPVLCQLLKDEPELAALTLVMIHPADLRASELWGTALLLDVQLPIDNPTELRGEWVRERLAPVLEHATAPVLDLPRRARLLSRYQGDALLGRIAVLHGESLMERALLQAMAAATTKLHTMEALVTEVLSLCSELLEFQCAGLYIYASRTLYTIGCGADPSDEFATAMGEQAEIFAGLADFEGDFRRESLPLLAPRTTPSAGPATAFFAVPLLDGEETIGVLGVSTSKAYTRRDYYLRNLGLLAQQIALALKVAVLYRQVQDLSRTDELTRLLNRRAFFERARDEALRHTRFRAPFSVLMSDIDHFKQVNDTYGHYQGDVVLKEAAQLFMRSLRSIDVAARLGGEEYAVLLPETGPEGALVVAERLREAMEAHHFTPVEGTEPLRKTISIGVATYAGEGAVTIEELLALADQAMYVAKNTGRNQVVVAGTPLTAPP